MRRALIAITLSGTLVTGVAGCGGDNAPTGAAPSAAPSSAEPSPSAVDHTADTRRICDELKKSTDAAVKEFGAGIGQMIEHRRSGNTAEAAKAKQTVQQKTTQLATLVRTSTAEAQDPEFQRAGAQMADNIAASAKDEAFFARIKTVKDLDNLEGELAGWVVPTAAYCG